jgi:AraC-like DNA-binding protein
MYNIIALSIVTTVGILSTIIVIRKNNENKFSFINRYLIILMSITVVRFLVNGLSQLYLNENLLQLTSLLNFSAAFALPCIYLYFQDLVFQTKFNPKHLYHFIPPLVLATFFIIFFIPKQIINTTDIIAKIYFISCFLYYVIYTFLTFKLLYKNVWKRKSEIKTIQEQNKAIKYWTGFVFTVVIILSITRFSIWIFLQNFIILDRFYIWIQAFLWSIIFIKIILQPEILYGFNLLSDTIDKATKKISFKHLWNEKVDKLSSSNEKDQKLAEKIAPTIPSIINKINEVSFNSNTFRETGLTMEDLARTLDLPASHVSFAFKHHCTETFTDFKKVVRIHDACKLLDEGYLNKNTVESLAELVGFASYHTFYVAFKSITGTSTQDYIKRV